MSFEINRGLFALDIIDHHAILGIPLTSASRGIRKRYLRIAPRLHPDTCGAKTPEGKEYAKDLMSKLVNPAYATLSNDGKRADHEAVLRVIQGRLADKPTSIPMRSSLAEQLRKESDLQGAYNRLIEQVSKIQYGDLRKTLAAIATISELNLVYLARSSKAVSSPKVSTSPRPTGTATPPPKSAPPRPAPAEGSDAPTVGVSFIERALQRATELVNKGQLPMAVQELKDALKRDGSNAACHALLGQVYLQQNQATLAKVHLNRALALEPGHPIATAAKQKLAKQSGSSSSSASSSSRSRGQSSSSKNKSDNGGLFGGLFGGRKK
ncbi:MAG: J domain-containing protein [Cyanobacteria bacterium P01_D01_bin.73]